MLSSDSPSWKFLHFGELTETLKLTTLCVCVCVCVCLRVGWCFLLVEKTKPQRQSAAVQALDICQTYGTHISYVIRSKATRVIITQQLRRPDVA